MSVLTAKSTQETQPLLPTTTSDALERAARPHALLGMACVALSAVSFSLVMTLVKYNTRFMSSMDAIFWRSVFAIALNYICIWHRGLSVYVAPEDRRLLFFRCLAGFLSIAFAFYAVSRMVLADASAIVFTSPVFTFFLGACLLHERIDGPSFACALLSFGGLVCVVRPSFLFGADHAAAGSHLAVGAALLGAIGQAFVYVLVRRLTRVHFLVIVHYFMLASIAGSLLFAVFVQRALVVPHSLTLWATVALSGVFTFSGQLLLTRGFQLEKAGVAAVMRYLDVICVFVWDAALLGEAISAWSVLGAAIICGCAAVIALRKAYQ